MSDSSDDEVLATRKATNPKKAKPAAAAKPAVKKEPVSKDVGAVPNKAANIKKEIEEDTTVNAKAGKSTNAKQVKPKTEEKESVKVKKEYELPGQTKETPPENDALRKFYTSLMQQRPNSDMAKKWCLQYGLLPADEAEAYIAELKARKDAERNGVSRPSVKKEPAVKKEAATPTNKRANVSNGNGAAKTNGTAARASPAARKGKTVAYSESESEEEEKEVLPSKNRAAAGTARGSAAAARTGNGKAASAATTKGRAAPVKKEKEEDDDDDEEEEEEDNNSEEDVPISSKRKASSAAAAGPNKRVIKKAKEEDEDEDSSDDDKPLGARGRH